MNANNQKSIKARIEVKDKKEKLHRQVSEAWLDEDGIPTSQAYHPYPKDDGMLSVTQDSKENSYNAWLRFTKQKGFNSEGVTSFDVDACHSCELLVYEDPMTTPPELVDPAHAVVDFTLKGSTEKEHKKVAKKLKPHGVFTRYKPRPSDQKLP